MADKLYVEIGASIDDLKKALKEAGYEVSKYSKDTQETFNKAEKSTKGLANELKGTGRAVRELDTHTKGLATGWLNVAKASRISGTAMRTALLASGIGALIVGLNLVIEHWGKITDAVDGSKRGLQQYLDKIDKLKEKDTILDDHVKSLDKIKKLYGLVGLEVDKLERQQNIAVREQIKGLKDQQGEVEKLYNQLTANVQSNWYGFIHDGITEDDQKALTDYRKQFNDLGNQITDAEIQLAEWNEETTGVVINIPKITQATKDLNKELLKQAGILKKLRSAEAKYDLDQLKNRRKALEGSFDMDFTAPDFVTQFNEFSQSFQQISRDLETSAPDWTKVYNTAGLEDVKTAFQFWMEDIQFFLEDFATNVQKIVVGNITNAFAGIGIAIGQALKTGENVLGAIGGALTQALASFLGEIGQLLITYGTLAIAKGVLDEAMWIPGAGIAAGAAAIAVGLAMTVASGAIGQRSSSGLNGTTSSASVNSSSNLASATTVTRSRASTSDGGGTYVFEIAGTKLIGVIQNSLARNSSLGGTNLLTG